jgi:hypothetical protein
MRWSLKDLMDTLEVGYALGPYETCPWSHYDSQYGITFSAEVRMNSSGDEIEAEIQSLTDEPDAQGRTMQQIFYLRILPSSQAQAWEVNSARLKQEPVDSSIYNWQEKSCNFIAAIVRCLRMEETPDIEAIIQECFHDYERFSDQYGGGSSKSPKIRPNQLLDIKKGRGF